MAAGVLLLAEEGLMSEQEILQDCSSEHSSLTKTDSDPPGDLSLPGVHVHITDDEHCVEQYPR